MLYIISLGGSLIVPGQIDVQFLRGFRNLILSQVKKGNRFIIVCGGGRIARNYFAALRKITKVKSAEYDRLGIRATQLNDELLRIIFKGIAYKQVHEVKDRKVRFKILIGTGFFPGVSSDFDAVKYAEKYGAKTILNLTNIDYVYDKDPKYPGAKPMKKLSWHQYSTIIGKTWKPGMHYPFDPRSSREAAKHKLNVVIINGKNLSNVKRCLDGNSFHGTVIW